MATLIGTAAGHFTTRARRRALVVGFFLGFAASVTAHMMSGGPGPLILLASVMFTTVFIGALLLHLARSTAGEDERMLRVRERANALAYQIFMVMFTTAMLYALVVLRTGRGWVPTTEMQWLNLMAGVAVLSVILPAALIVWTEPDLPVETPEEREDQRRALQGVPFPPGHRRIRTGLVILSGLLVLTQFALPEPYDEVVGWIAGGVLLVGSIILNRCRGPKR